MFGVHVRGFNTEISVDMFLYLSTNVMFSDRREFNVDGKLINIHTRDKYTMDPM